MPLIQLAPAIARWLPEHPSGSPGAWTLEGTSVREVFDRLFQLHPVLRSYLVDDLGRLRHHVVVFVDGIPVTDKNHLATPLAQESEVYVFQALSGG